MSGGIDSATCLAIAKWEGYEAYCLTFYYGQRHALEVEAAKRVAAQVGAKEHLILELDLRKIGGSALTADIPVPKGKEMRGGIPVTYVPARNTIFLSYALAWAEVLGTEDIFIGVSAIDYSGYPDCRPEYIAAFEGMANLALKGAVEGRMRIKIHAPLLAMGKGDIIKKGLELGVDFSLTHSCYDPGPDGSACGVCDSCLIRKKGFAKAGVPDPTRYANCR